LHQQFGQSQCPHVGHDIGSDAPPTRCRPPGEGTLAAAAAEVAVAADEKCREAAELVVQSTVLAVTVPV
jgi:hypothetical protein